MKVIRRCASGILLIVALLCILVIALPDRYIKSIIISVTQSLTDRQLHIGTLQFERSLQPRLTLTDVVFSNAQWASADHLFVADNISASIQISALFKGRLVVLDATSKGIEAHLEISENGEQNWQLSAKPTQLPPLSLLTFVNVNAIDTLITFIDERSGTHQRLALDDVSLGNESSNNNLDIVANGQINSLPISAVLTLPASQRASVSIADALHLPYKLALTAGDIKVMADGQLNTSAETPKINSDLSVNIASLSQLGHVINKPLPHIGPIGLKATLEVALETITSEGLQIPDLHLTITDPLLQLDARGSFTDIFASSTGSVQMSLDSPDTEQLLAKLNVRRRLPGKLNVDAALTGSENRYDIELQRADFVSEFIEAELSGVVSDIFTTAHANVAVKLDTPDLSVVTQLFGTRMPPEWGPVAATALLEGESGHYALNNIDATLSGNSTARAKGSINSLIPFDDMHLDVDVSLSTLEEVSAFTKKPLPDIGPMTGTGVVGWQNGALFLQDARASHDSQYGIAVVTGDIGDLIRFDKVRLRADADLPNFSALDLFTGFALPEVDHVVASTNLISANAGDISARQLTVSTTLDNITVVGKGAVESFIKPKISVDLKLESSMESLTQLNSLTASTLPDLGPLQATAQLSGRGKAFTLNNINALLNDNNLSGVVNSQLDDLTNFDDMTFDVVLESDNVSALATQLGFDRLNSVPAKLSTKVHVNGNSVQLKNADIDIDGNRASGNISMVNVLHNEHKTMLSGEVILANVDTTTLFNKTVADQKTLAAHSEGGKPAKGAEKKTRALPDRSLSFHFLQQQDVDLTVKIENLTSSLLDIANANLNILAQDGVFSIAPFSGTVNNGLVDFHGVVNTNVAPIKSEINLTLNGVSLARAMLFEGTDLLKNTGGTWGNLSLKSEGDSIAKLLSSASGEGGIYIEDLRFNKNVLSFLSSDLIEQLVDALNPFTDKMMMGSELYCSALTFQIQDGQLATPFGFAAEAENFSVIGEAQVNFQNETLEIMFNPIPKTGLGISLNRLAGLVKLDGAIASPSLTLDATGIFQFGASIAAAVASSGVTLLAEGLYNKHTAMSDVCSQALGNKN